MSRSVRLVGLAVVAGLMLPPLAGCGESTQSAPLPQVTVRGTPLPATPVKGRAESPVNQGSSAANDSTQNP